MKKTYITSAILAALVAASITGCGNTASNELLDDGWTVVTADGEVSCHEEHTVAVFEDHTEVLTDLNYKNI